MERNKKLYYNYILLYATSYAAMGGLFPLIGQYLSDIGFSGAQIGTITGSGTFAAIFATAVWGNIYNVAKRKSGVVLLLCGLSAIIAINMPQLRAFGAFVVVYSAFYFFQQPINALSDAMVMEDKERFNVIRMWGAIGYALAVFVSGKLADVVGTSVIFQLATAGFIVAIISVIAIGTQRGEIKRSITHTQNQPNGNDSLTSVHAARKKSNLEGYKALLKNPTYVKILVVALFVGGTNVANNTYFSFLFEDAGGDLSGLGFTMLLMVGSEAPFMFLSAKLSEKFTLEKMILISIVISACRFLWYSTVPSTTMLTAFFFLQGMVNGIILVEFIKYVSKISDEDNLGLAVSTYYIVSSSISGIICQLVGGVVLDYAGGAGVYFLFGAMNVVAAVLYVIFGLYKSEVPE